MLAITQSLIKTAGMAEVEPAQQRQQSAPEPYVEGNLKLLEVIVCGCEVMCVRFNPEGNIIAAGLKDGCIRIYSTDTGQALYSLTDSDTNKRHLSVTSVKFCPADPSDPKVEHHHMLMATLDSVVFAFLLPLEWGNVYELNTKKIITTCGPSDSRDVMNGHRARVFAIQYHPTDPHLFVTGGWDDTVQIWDDRKKHSVRKIFGPHVCGDALDIDGNHNHLLTASWRKSEVLQIWDFATGEKIKDVPQDHMHGSLLYSAQWLGREHIVCGGCEQNMARVIDRGTLNTVGQLVDLPSGVFSIDQERSPPNNRSPRVIIAAGKKIYTVRIDNKRQ